MIELKRSETICFSGHRHIDPRDSASLGEKVYALIHQMYEKGYTNYICGGARGFDTVAALEVIRFRTQYPDVRLVIAVPCRSQADKWPPKDRDIYRRILEEADETVILSEIYYTGCMQSRNRYMVDSSSMCICYMTRFEGGTWSTVRYALHCGILVKNVAVPDTADGLLKENAWNYICTSRSVYKNANTAPLFPFRAQKYRRKNISGPLSGKQK